MRCFPPALNILVLSRLSIIQACRGFTLLDASGTAVKRRTIYTTLQEPKRTGLWIRGGAIDSSRLRGRKGDSAEYGIENAGHEIIRQKGMGAALAATYFTVMASKCALPAVLVQLTSPKIGLRFSNTWTSSNQVLMARLLALSTIAIASGKLLLGPVIDYFGGVLSLKAALTALALLMGTISVTNSFEVFSFCWIFVDFIFSSCWAGCINAIHQSFPEKEWAKRIGMLAAAARTGNAAAFAFFAWLLHASQSWAQPWRVVFAASALIQVIPVILLSSCAPDSVQTKTTITPTTNMANNTRQLEPIEQMNTRNSMKDSLRTLQREASTPEFWLHLISRSVLMVYASFLLFVPSLMSKVYGASPSFAAQVGSIYALGCLLSVTLGSNAYAKLRRNHKVVAVMSLLGMSTLSSVAQYGHMKGLWQLSQAVSAASFFLWGFSFAIPFYIPPSLYALAKGGMKSSATIADVFDIGGFALLAAFNGYVASIQDTVASQWIATFQLTTGCSVIAFISLTLVTLLETKD